MVASGSVQLFPNEQWPYEPQFKRVNSWRMHYIDEAPATRWFFFTPIRYGAFELARAAGRRISVIRSIGRTQGSPPVGIHRVVRFSHPQATVSPRYAKSK
jgi:hypothetical protein